jgi:uncharacterized repeat protein (TIGR03803 family)
VKWRFNVKKDQEPRICRILRLDARHPQQDNHASPRRAPMTKRVACVVLLLCAAAVAASAQTFTTIAAFDGTNGSEPSSGFLVQGFDGNLYGTTVYGAAGDGSFCELTGCGAAFQITTGGLLTPIYTFCALPSCADGGEPPSGLTQATDGNLYGGTFLGGTNACCGTAFRLMPNGTLTTLYDFCECTAGARPNVLTEGADGSFYGTAIADGGGDQSECPFGCGAIFKLTPEGALTPIYSFCSLPDCADGDYPLGGLIQSGNGTFYGTTYVGGAHGEGTVFKITRSGTLTTLYSFCSQLNDRGWCIDGALPAGSLTRAENGDFYGTTYFGGMKDYGTVFKINAQGDLETLYSFNKTDDGAYPLAGLVQATDGILYGTTSAGGNDTCMNGFGCGTIFKVSAGGTLNTLHIFAGTDGETPEAGLTQATDGNLYGSTTYGGGGSGSIFRLSLGLSPFIETLTTSGKAGAHVVILGNNLTGSTSVSFNGIAAAFTVISDTEITATVPTGATSGPVTVPTASGVLKSKPFRVIP